MYIFVSNVDHFILDRKSIAIEIVLVPLYIVVNNAYTRKG